VKLRDKVYPKLKGLGGDCPEVFSDKDGKMEGMAELRLFKGGWNREGDQAYPRFKFRGSTRDMKFSNPTSAAVGNGTSAPLKVKKPWGGGRGGG